MFLEPILETKSQDISASAASVFSVFHKSPNFMEVLLNHWTNLLFDWYRPLSNCKLLL